MFVSFVSFNLEVFSAPDPLLPIADVQLLHRGEPTMMLRRIGHAVMKN
jgi:hypothetical protein